jgi:hypothetical protein
MSTIPVGGSTGCDHQDNPAIDEAVIWLAAQKEAPHPVVPSLRARFNLSTLDACIALREAAEMRRRALS